MTNFFSSVVKLTKPILINPNPPSSPHVLQQRTSVGALSMNAGLQKISPITSLGPEFIDMIGCIYAFFCAETVIREKIIHLIHFVLTLARFVIDSILFFTQEPCTSTQRTQLCLADDYLWLLYAALATAGWISTEYFHAHPPAAAEADDDEEQGQTAARLDTVTV